LSEGGSAGIPLGKIEFKYLLYAVMASAEVINPMIVKTLLILKI
jgi:hypothetical protein